MARPVKHPPTQTPGSSVPAGGCQVLHLYESPQRRNSKQRNAVWKKVELLESLLVQRSCRLFLFCFVFLKSPPRFVVALVSRGLELSWTEKKGEKFFSTFGIQKDGTNLKFRGINEPFEKVCARSVWCWCRTLVKAWLSVMATLCRIYWNHLPSL